MNTPVEITLPAYPAYAIVLHKLATMGREDFRSPYPGRFLRFNLNNHPLIRVKWAELADADEVFMIYNEPRRSPHVVL